ncbi:MAG: SDR family NAD(P)-dependent oxidoreductase [Candidatus Dormibacteraceae bacterium]
MVTGGGGGIGRGCVDRLVAAGVAVAVADAREGAAQETAQQASGGIVCRGYHLDVRDGTQIRAVFEEAWSQLGPVDVLVNAAGLYPSDPLLEMTEDSWNRVLDTNLKGPHLCVGEFARRLVADHRPGAVVNISSGAGRRARLGASHYCASKAGLDMLTRAQALELAQHGIRVNAVAPGFVRVDSDVNPLSEEYTQAITHGIPLGRSGQPTDIGDAVVFLCSEQAGWITGAVLQVDGGSSTGTLALPLSRPVN